MKNSLSLVIPCKNASDTLEAVLKTITSYQEQPDEIILVDDGSTDDSVLIAKKYGVKVIKLFKSFGAGHARNLGVKYAKSDIIAFIDTDVIPHEDWLSLIKQDISSGSDGVTGIYNQRPTGNVLFNEIYNLQENLFWRQLKNGDIAPTIYGGICAFTRKSWLCDERTFQEEILFQGMASGEDCFILEEISKKNRITYNSNLIGDHFTDFWPRFKSRSINQGYSRFRNMLYRFKHPEDEAVQFYNNGVVDHYNITSRLLSEASFLLALMFLFIGFGSTSICFFLLSFTLLLKVVSPFFKHLPEKRFQTYRILFQIQILQQFYWNIGVLKAIFTRQQNLPRKLFRLFLSAINYLNKTKLSKVYFFVTSKCNFTCEWCLDKARSDENINDGLVGKLSIENLRILAKKNKLRVPFFVITGGEPYLRKDIDEITYLLYTEFKTTFVTIVTNGSFPDRTIDSIRRILIACPDLTINLQLTVYSTEKMHNEIRGGDNSYQQIVQLAKELTVLQQQFNSKQLIITTATNLDKINIDGYKTICDTIKNEIKPDQQIFSLIREGDGFINPPDDALERLPEILDFVRSNYSKTAHSLIQTVYMNVILKTLQIYKEIRTDGKNRFKCLAGKKFITLYEDGKVALCENRRDLRMGNVADYDFDLNELLKKEDAKNAYNTQVKEKCTCDWPSTINEHLMTNYTFQFINLISSTKKYLFSTRK
jgi:glycosyltransferase involved in cell wall biosynthesis/MoaA/NifB/PqqE/SkfB family radical SAM enzyme